MRDPITVYGQVVGGSIEEFNLAASSTVADLRDALGLSDAYTAADKASGNPISESSTLVDNGMYMFSKNTEAGA